jgi:hypothetical protein
MFTLAKKLGNLVHEFPLTAAQLPQLDSYNVYLCLLLFCTGVQFQTGSTRARTRTLYTKGRSIEEKECS